MSKIIRFTQGELEREIAIRGLSQEAFAKVAEIDPATVSRATRGLRVYPKSLGKIIAALGKIPVVDGPTELVKAS